MDKINFQVERVSDVLDEIKPLLIAHWEEIAMYKDRFPLNPDYEKYKALDAAGMAHVVTARTGVKGQGSGVMGELIGYCISFIMPHMHYQDCIIALNDILFIKSEYRHGRTGMKMISFAEQELTKLGVHRMIIHVKILHDFSPLLDHMGFAETERNWEKLLTRRAD